MIAQGIDEALQGILSILREFGYPGLMMVMLVIGSIFVARSLGRWVKNSSRQHELLVEGVLSSQRRQEQLYAGLVTEVSKLVGVTRDIERTADRTGEIVDQWQSPQWLKETLEHLQESVESMPTEVCRKIKESS